MDSAVNKRQKSVVSIIGTLLIALSLVFIVRRFLDGDIDFAILASPSVVISLIVLAFANSFVMIVTAANYRAWIYNVSGEKIPFPSTINIYCIANLYKYIPSGVLNVIGRNRLAVEHEELSHGKVAVATFLEGLFFVLFSAITALALSFYYVSGLLRQITLSPAIILIIVGVLATIALIVYLLRGRIKKLFATSEMTGILKLPALVKRGASAFALATTWGVVFVIVLIIVGQPMTFGLALTVIGLFNVSWLTGFFVIVAPAGFGVREAAMLVFMGGIVIEGYLLLALMSHRLVAISSDVIAYLISLAIRYNEKKEAS